MTTIEVNSQTLKALLGYTTYAAARDDSRPVLRAVHLRVTTTEDGDATLHAETTDGFRLAHASAPCAIVGELESDRALLPLDAAKSLHKQISKWDEPLHLRFPTTAQANPGTEVVGGTGQPVFIEAGSDHISSRSRVIEGTFPEVQQLIPKQHKTEVGVNAATLLAAVKRCDIIARENDDALRIDIANQGNSEYEHFLTLSANAAETGSAKETINEGIFRGKSMTIAFNGGFVEDVLTAGKPDGVTMRFQGPNNAGVFIPINLDGIDVTCVLAPMHLAA